MATFGTKILAVGFFATDTPNHTHLTQNSCLARFRGFLFRDEKWDENMSGNAILATFDTKILAVGFFATDTPNHPYLTQNSCLARFRGFLFQDEKWDENMSGNAILATFGTKILAVGFFATDAPNHLPLTQNSCLAWF